MTDVFKMIIDDGVYSIITASIEEENQYQIQGVNTTKQLEELTATYLSKIQ